MDKTEVLRVLAHLDHTVLGITATQDDIVSAVDDAIAFGCASVCIPPAMIMLAANKAKGRIPICTTVGFPNGYSATETKIFETRKALADGADEIDMVINIVDLKSRNLAKIYDEICAVRAQFSGVLKVIVESAVLSLDEKITICKIVTDAKADFIKTSTGFAKGGATVEDIALFKKHIGSDVRIKASGGIRTLESAVEFLNLGADRIGASSLVSLARGFVFD